VGQPALTQCHAHSDNTLLLLLLLLLLRLLLGWRRRHSATPPQQQRCPPLCRALYNSALSGTLPASWSALSSLEYM
jgi:hypothetical protein